MSHYMLVCVLVTLGQDGVPRLSAIYQSVAVIKCVCMAGCTARGRRGVCGPIINCPALLTLLNLIKAGRAPPQAVDTLRR